MTDNSDIPVTIIRNGEQLTIPRINPQNLKRIMDGRDNIMFIADINGKIGFCSAAFTEITELATGDSSDLLYGNLMTREARRRVFDGYQEIIETEFIVRDSIVTLLLTLLPYESEGDIYLLAIGKDLTEQRKLECLNREYERLWDLALMAGKLAHELNNPLSYMVYNMDVLEKEIPQLVERVKSDVRTEASYSKTMENIPLALSDSLLGLSQIKEIAQSLSMFSHFGKEGALAVNVNYIIDMALTMARPELKYRMNVERQYNSQKAVYASEGKLYHIFLNLILFASRQVLEGSAKSNILSVESSDLDNSVSIRFSFPYTAIEDVTEENLFNPLSIFNTSHRINTPALSAFLLEKSSSTLKFNKVGNTGIFTVLLPEYKNKKARVMTHEFCSPEGSKMRILVVDDNPGIRNLFGRMLENCFIATCESGNSALELLESGKVFDLIVCDVLMPEMNGKEFHERVTTKYPQLGSRFIMVSGGLLTPEIYEYIQKLEIPLVEKPLEIDQLKKAILETVMR